MNKRALYAKDLIMGDVKDGEFTRTDWRMFEIFINTSKDKKILHFVINSGLMFRKYQKGFVYFRRQEYKLYIFNSEKTKTINME